MPLAWHSPHNVNVIDRRIAELAACLNRFGYHFWCGMIGQKGGPLNRIVTLALVATHRCRRWRLGRSLARVMESGEAAVARQAMPAVVNISTWKVGRRQPWRSIAAGEDLWLRLHHRSLRHHRHQQARHRRRADITIIFETAIGRVASCWRLRRWPTLRWSRSRSVDPLPSLQWGDSTALHVGDPVLTIGNPLGLGMSVSSGIVSALNRDIQDTPFDNYIQTIRPSIMATPAAPWSISMARWLASIPRFITLSRAAASSVSGFAIPADTAKFVVGQLLDPRHPKPGWLGLTLQDVTTELAEALDLAMRRARSFLR